MSRLKKLFSANNKNILNVYCTAGFPHLTATLDVMTALQNSGANIMELGMPYSDPLADGEVIQQSSNTALANGMTIAVLFEQLKSFRKTITIPVVLMGYMNPVMQYGFEKFCKDAAAIGIDGLILPDMPVYEFENKYGIIIKENNLDFIFLVTPETPEERVRKLDALSSGFLYAVSSSSTTGSSTNMNDVNVFTQKLKKYNLQNPVLVGFGIKDKTTFDAACQNSSGAIIGTAYIKALSGTTDINNTTKDFLNSILQ